MTALATNDRHPSAGAEMCRWRVVREWITARRFRTAANSADNWAIKSSLNAPAVMDVELSDDERRRQTPPDIPGDQPAIEMQDDAELDSAPAWVRDAPSEALLMRLQAAIGPVPANVVRKVRDMVHERLGRSGD